MALYHAYPDPLLLGELRKAAKYGNSTRFRELMEAEDKQARVHIKGNDVYLSRKGVAWVEKNIDLRLKVE